MATHGHNFIFNTVVSCIFTKRSTSVQSDLMVLKIIDRSKQHVFSAGRINVPRPQNAGDGFSNPFKLFKDHDESPNNTSQNQGGAAASTDT
jgi:hypothetical protein